MSNKKLTERLHDELDELGVPALMTERVQACSKMFELPKFKIEALLHGVALDSMTMQKIADELEVSTDWLFGGLKKRQNTKPKISCRLGHFDPTKLKVIARTIQKLYKR